MDGCRLINKVCCHHQPRQHTVLAIHSFIVGGIVATLVERQSPSVVMLSSQYEFRFSFNVVAIYIAI